MLQFSLRKYSVGTRPTVHVQYMVYWLNLNILDEINFKCATLGVGESVNADPHPQDDQSYLV